MGSFRLYPSKSNTIIEDSPLVNTGQNEVAELWFGNSGLTRHLIKFDFDTYNVFESLGYVPNVTGASPEFKLMLINPIELATGELLGESFDLEVYIIDRDWDAGSGYDFEGSSKENGFSNWYSATSVQAWTSPGGDFTNLIFSGHVDVPESGESLTFSFSDADQLMNSITGNNYGFLIKFSNEIEAMTTTNKTISRFHTDNSHTYFKPYIQLTWEDSYAASSAVTLSGTDIAYRLTMPDLKDEYPNDGMSYVPVMPYREYTSSVSIIDNLEYQIKLIDGNDYFDMTPWDEVEYSNENGNRILLNLEHLFPNYEYQIRFRAKVDNAIKYYLGTFNFKVAEA